MYVKYWWLHNNASLVCKFSKTLICVLLTGSQPNLIPLQPTSCIGYELWHTCQKIGRKGSYTKLFI